MKIITDIDHTLSDARHRDYILEATNVDWDAYHLAGRQDDPVPATVRLVNLFHEAGYETIALTGIPEKFRILTMERLFNYDVRIDDLWMRPNGDFRPAPIVKMQLIKEEVPDFNDIGFIIDDNVQCILEFRANGIQAFRIKFGDFHV